jgi:hypothetical protein
MPNGKVIQWPVKAVVRKLEPVKAIQRPVVILRRAA